MLWLNHEREKDTPKHQLSIGPPFFDPFSLMANKGGQSKI